MNQVIVALDLEHLEEVEHFLSQVEGQHVWVKVGMELFYGQGLGVIELIKSKGHSIFLDLKLHDIPNTVKRAMKKIASLDVDMVNVHAAGGIAMMKAAIEGLEEGSKNKKRPLCIAVTQLTSTDQKMLVDELCIDQPMNDVILHYAKNASLAGLDGVVCSPLESRMIHENIGDHFLTVTPGIRLLEDAVNDQKRVTTPEMARTLGSDYIVVGRSITANKQPLKTYHQICQMFSKENN